jgi:hypothetical protein
MTFPDRQPSSRAFTHGIFPQTTMRGSRGAVAMVRHGIGSHGHQLSLSYVGLTIAEASEFRTHYNQAETTFATFALPSSVWSDGDAFTANLIDGHQWRYQSPPTYENVGCDHQNVTVSLITAPWSATFKGLPNHLGSLMDVGLGVPVAGDELAYNGSSWWSQP